MKLFAVKSLYFKLVSYLFLVAIVFISLATFIFFRIEIERADNQAALMINQLIDTIEPTAAVAVYANNSHIAQEVLDGLLRNDVVYKATIRNDKDLFLEKKKDNPQADNPKEIIRELLSPFKDKKSIGQLSIIPNAEFCLNEAKYSAFSIAISCFILTVFILLFMLIMIRLLFSKPLIQISEMLHDISVGEQERIEPLENNKNDEVGHLVVSINKILDLLNTKLSTQEALRKQIQAVERKLRNIFVSTSAGLFLLDKEGNVLVCTPTVLKIFGFQDANLISINGQDFAKLFFKEPAKFQKMMKNALEFEQLEAQDLMLYNDTVENPFWVHCLLSKIVDTSGVTCFEGVIFDISKRVASEKAMYYEANHDALTGLLRRNAAELQLRKHLAAEKKVSTIVLLLDLDGFKKANDTYGHDAGDEVLIQTARRLESCVRHHDIVCRLGGDEFLIILFDCSPVSTGFGIAEQIIHSIRVPVTIQNQVNVFIGVSIGIAVFPMHGKTVETLLKSADEAMYEVKRNGKNGYGIRGKSGKISVNRPLAKK
jgi:diguanylate cyclase (GGDEF)-like protein/PAS domain S-box-containing protein